MARLFDAHGPSAPDLLVNNAGTNNADATADLSVEDFERVMRVNVTGPFLCAREVFRRSDSADGAAVVGRRIVNVGSISAQSPRPDGLAYATSKYAMEGLTRSLALDGRERNVAVGVIHPGNVKSAMLSPEEVERREAAEGFVDPEDVGNCVLTMASLPYHANVLEMTVIPTRQPLVGRG